ncbi:MAG: Ig-like domain-containing protein [Oceanococcus sp.]
MRTKSTLFCTVISSVLALSACSDGPVFNLQPTPSPEVLAPGDVPVRTPGNVRLLLSNPVLNSGVSRVADITNPIEAVTITAVVTDEGAVVIPDQAVNFALPNRDATLQIIDEITDASGAARAFITTGGDVSNRTVSVIATAGEVSQTIDVKIDGTSVNLSGPGSLGLGSTATYTARLSNGRGQESATSGGIAGESITVSSAPGTALSVEDGGDLVTDVNGLVNFTVRGVQATAANAAEVLTVSALNEAADLSIGVSQFSLNLTGPSELQTLELGESIQITANLTDSTGVANGEALDIAATRGTVSPSSVTTDANGQAIITFTASGGSGVSLIRFFGPSGAVADRNLQLVSASPFRVDLQTDPGTLEVNDSTVLTATVRDQFGNLVQDQIVEFVLQDVTGGRLSAPRAISDAQGRASVTYTASSASSANRGVVVRAFTPGSYDFANGLACNDSDGDGTDNENEDGNGVNLDGNFLCDQFSLTVGGFALRVALGTGNELEEPTTTTYRMPWSALVTDSRGNPAPPETSLRLKVTPLAYQKGVSVFFDPTWERVYSVGAGGFGEGCVSEDLNENGVLDPSEDISQDGSLTPSNVASVPQGTGDGNDLVPLTSEGFAFFDIAYAQQYAYWVRVRLTAIASVDGTETVETQVFLLPGIADDFNQEDVAPPGAISPFGTSPNCNDSD